MAGSEEQDNEIIISTIPSLVAYLRVTRESPIQLLRRHLPGLKPLFRTCIRSTLKGTAQSGLGVGIQSTFMI